MQNRRKVLWFWYVVGIFCEKRLCDALSKEKLDVTTEDDARYPLFKRKQ